MKFFIIVTSHDRLLASFVTIQRKCTSNAAWFPLWIWKRKMKEDEEKNSKIGKRSLVLNFNGAYEMNLYFMNELGLLNAYSLKSVLSIWIVLCVKFAILQTKQRIRKKNANKHPTIHFHCTSFIDLHLQVYTKNNRKTKPSHNREKKTLSTDSWCRFGKMLIE